MNNNVVITVKNLTKIYKKHKFIGIKQIVGVESLSFEVYNNEIFGLLGLNGSGKTTTIKLILGLLHPDEGEIYFKNQKLPDWRINRDVGYLPEMVSFNRRFSAYELLKFYSQLSGGVTEERIKEVLDFVGLTENMNRKIAEFSKGMLQRLGIAQAIVHNPSLLIFDEPTSGLDPLGIKEIRDFILKLKSQGKTIFFSSHLISELEKVCDRVAIIHKGKIVRIVNNTEWQKVPLEEIFVDCVTG